MNNHIKTFFELSHLANSIIAIGPKINKVKDEVKLIGDSLVVFDHRVSDLPTLLKGVIKKGIAQVLTSNEDALLQINQWLSQTRVKRLAIVAHGEPGVVHIGATPLTVEQLQAKAHLLQEWGLEEIALYSCEVAKGDRGLQFIKQLKQLTGASVSAASTKVGNPDLGGFWDLNVINGTISSPFIFTPAVTQQYQGLLNPEPVQYKLNLATASSSPSRFTDVNGTLYFVSTSTIGSFLDNLWKIDPSTNTPIRVTNFNDTSSGYYIYDLTNVNGALYFIGTEEYGDRELWKVDPSTGNPSRITLRNTNGRIIEPFSLITVNNALYLTAAENLWELESSTNNLIPLESESGQGLSPQNPIVIDDTLYFFDNINSTNNTELWKIDPSTGNPVRITEIAASVNQTFPNQNQLVDVNGTLYFTATNSTSGTELWKIDSNIGEPILLDIVAGPESSSPQDLTPVNGSLYFTAINALNTRELWKIDSSTGESVQVEIASDLDISYGSQLINVNGTLYFTGSNNNTRELWKVDSFTGQAVRVTDIAEESYGLGSLINVNDTLYFTATDNANGEELWKIDLVSEQSTRVTDIAEGPNSSNPEHLTNINGTLYFSATNDTYGKEIWKIDSDTGRLSLIDVNTQGIGSFPSSLVNVNDTLYFSARNNTNGRELWKIDSSIAEPVRVTDLVAGNGDSSPDDLVNVNGTLYFTATDQTNGKELWKIDPSTGDSVRLEIQSGSNGSFPDHLISVNGILYFTATNQTNGTELWKIDSITGEPVLLEIQPGVNSSSPDNFTNVNGTLYFTATNSTNGRELWKIDPANGNPLRLEIEAGLGGSDPTDLTIVNGTLYFTAENSSHGRELWKIDPATGNPLRITDLAAGPRSYQPKDLTDVNGTLYFTADNSSHGRELWRIDPVNGNPIRVTDIATGDRSSDPEDLTDVNGTLYFTALNNNYERELWKIDGITGKIVRLEIPTKYEDANPSRLTNINNTLYFVATNDSTGEELWRINPETNQPELTYDFNPGSGSSNPLILGFEKGKLYVSADNGNDGQQLWVLDLDSTAPSITNVLDSVGPIRGSVANGASTDDRTPTVVISLTDTNALVGDTLQLFDGTTQIASRKLTSQDIGAGTVSITPKKKLQPGDYSITASIVDAEGNESDVSSSYSFNLDRRNPYAPRIFKVAGNDRVKEVEKDAGVTVFGRAEANSTVKVAWGSTTLTTKADATGNWSQAFTPEQIPADGQTTVRAKAIDAAGNSSNTARRSVLVDAIAPTATVNEISGFSKDTGLSDSDLITKIAHQRVSGTFTGVLTADEVIQVSVDDGTHWIKASTQGSNWTARVKLESGSNRVMTRTMDKAGNVTLGVSQEYILDQAAPQPIVNGYGLDSIQGTTEADATVFLSTGSKSLPSKLPQALAVADAMGNYQLDISSLAGSTTGKTYTLYSRDVAGNLSEASDERVVVGTSEVDTLTGVGSSHSDLLVGGAGIDTARYQVASNAISLTGQVSSASGSLNVHAANIDVLTGIEQLEFTKTGYTSTTNTDPSYKELKSTIQTTLSNNSIAAFAGFYEASTGNFSFAVGSGQTANSTLLAYDANPGSGVNYETFLLLGNIAMNNEISLSGGTVTFDQSFPEKSFTG